MSDLGSDVNPLDLLAEEFVTRYRRGERPSLDEFIARRPDLADDIRDLFPGLVVMEGVRPDREDATGPYAGGDGSAPAKLGDYRILREVGRGGMGVVYEAEQESLGRHVALKVLPAHSLLDPQRLRRFQREAKAAARLHHTNIVPVFGVGEANGLHYYVMQFIQGQGLDAVLVELMALRGVKTPTPAHDGSVSAAGSLAPRTAHRLYRAGDASAVDMARSLLTGGFATMAGAPTPEDDASPLPAPLPATSGSNSAINLPGQSDTSRLSETGRAFWQSVARIGVQAAEALAYAHAQGTLHRDVKPSNLLLDTQGTVWVTDFGLAKAADSEDLTQAGDIVGTIRYMAPERFQGKSDARSDVYGLGLTLYEMLALRPAFDASDRNRLLHQVTHEAPPRPRAVNRDVPRDLETVVLKAIARDPAHRYASAGEVAADLGRFLEDKPIRARRVGLAEQLWRWGRRNPVVAGLTAAVLLLLLLGTAASVVAAYYFSRLAASENKARADADRANNDIVARDVEIRRQTDEQREESERLKRAYAFHESGAFHAAQNEFDKTLADYTREIEERPDIGRFWLERGQLYLQFYCWHEAAADFAKGFDLQPPADLDMWVAHAQLRQYVGDREGYRRACAELLARYGQTPDRAVASALASACIAGPGALDDYSRPIQLLEKAVADASAHNESATPYKIALISL
ncbi:MAG TPA: serine/threonine-protein kinase, partial [Gemmataceae bacterium]|nr:serine/threonine-protein kinase [Gemmataceae bacterium]